MLSYWHFPYPSPLHTASKATRRKAYKQQPSPPPQYASPAPGEGEGPEKNSPRSGGKGDSVGKGKKGPVRKMQGIPLKEDGTLGKCLGRLCSDSQSTDCSMSSWGCVIRRESFIGKIVNCHTSLEHVVHTLMATCPHPECLLCDHRDNGFL